MKKSEFELLLEDCLHHLDRGETLPQVLEKNGSDTESIEQLLLIAMAGRALPNPLPSRDAFRTGKIMLLAKMDIMQRENAFARKSRPIADRFLDGWKKRLSTPLPSWIPVNLQPAYRLVSVAVVLLMMGGALTVNASASSLPGDALYDLKLGMEQTRLFFTFNDHTKKQLITVFEAERLAEVEALMEQGRTEEVKFYGTVEEMGKSTWVISGVSVQQTSGNSPETNFDVGTEVEVLGIILDDGTLLELKTTAEIDEEEDKIKEDKIKDEKDKDKEEKDKDKEEKDKDKEEKDKDKDKDK